jgi:hypothetical protein
MNERIRELLTEIRQLEEELAAEMQVQQTELLYWFEGKKIRFENSIHEAHRRVKIGLLQWFSGSSPRNALSAPFIYGMIVPDDLLSPVQNPAGSTRLLCRH